MVIIIHHLSLLRLLHPMNLIHCLANFVQFNFNFYYYFVLIFNVIFNSLHLFNLLIYFIVLNLIVLFILVVLFVIALIVLIIIYFHFIPYFITILILSSNNLLSLCIFYLGIFLYHCLIIYQYVSLLFR